MIADRTPPTSSSVTIVGFGPVGKLLAIGLGRRGHRVVVVDRQTTGYPLPRAITHCSDFARILQSVGLAPDTIPEITEPYDDMYVWRNDREQTLLEVDWSGRGESGWYNTYFFHQPDLEDALDALVAELPSVHVARGWDAVAVRQESDLATVTVRSVDTDVSAEITSDWVIGADGANSQVRRWAGIDWHDEGYFHDWLVVDVSPRPDVDFPHVATQNCDHRRPSTMVPGGPGRRRWEFMRLPEETAESLSTREAAWNLLAPFGLTPDNADLERHALYTFEAGWATRWRSGRVLLAGDAAHLMPPFAGQGLGAGARDVMNLGWKLDAVLTGRADDTLLDSYDTERLHHLQAFVRFSVGLGEVICITDPEQAEARDAAMIADRDDGTPAPPRPGLGAGVHVGDTGGALALQGRVTRDGSSPALFDDVFGGPGAVITRCSGMLDALSPATSKLLAEWEMSLVALSGESKSRVEVIDDLDRTYSGWLDELGADVVLVRPDFHVYGAATAAELIELADGFIAGVSARVSTTAGSD